MGTAGRSCVKSTNFVFSQQIEKFNWRVSRGLYLSPVYFCESTNCNWVLAIGTSTVEANRKSIFGTCLSFFATYFSFFATYLAQYCDYIEMSLVRKDYKTEYQSVDVRLTIVDSFNIYSFYSSKEINFTPSVNRYCLLRIRKSDLSYGCCGLNKMRFMPNDILTVKCEITVYETTEENYTSENELEDTTKYVKKESIHWFLKFLGIVILVFCVFYFRFYFVASLFAMIGLVKAIWYFGSPGGDRTYVKPVKAVETQSKTVNPLPATPELSSGNANENAKTFHRQGVKSDDNNLTFRSTKNVTKDQLKDVIKMAPSQNISNRYENYYLHK